MTPFSRATLLFIALAVSGCALGTPSTPALTGPASLGTSILVSASPDLMARDGAAQSVITVTARDDNGQPIRNLPLRMDVKIGGALGDLGTLSSRNISTGSDGRANVIYTAPPPAAFGATNEATIQVVATPVGTDSANTTSSAVSIRLTSPGVIQPPNGAPVPSFFASPTSPHERENVLFDGSASKDPDGRVMTYAWSFGDGSTAPATSSPTVTHRYDLAGLYQATLTVTDDRGLTVTSAPTALTVAAAVNPVASFVFSPTTPQLSVAGSADVFFNASASSVPPGRAIVTWQWDFGDGSPLERNTGATTKHAYTAVRTYNVVLTVTDDIGRTGTVSVPVTVAAATNPVASFVFSPTNPTVGDRIYFDGTASAAATGRTLVSWEWNYGDGTALELKTGPITDHAFPLGAAKTYTVLLTVTDDLGRKGTVSVTVQFK